jgi:hypothetical protein
MGEALAVWALFAAVAVAVFVTYARLPAARLYHVSGSGLVGGASRALVFVNWPTAAAALAIAGLAATALPARWRPIALASMPLCAVAFVPGVVSQSNLDAKAVNAVPAVGAALALLATVVAARRNGVAWAPRRCYDAARVALAAVLVVGALPWIAAELGFSFVHVPVLGTLFQTGELRVQPGSAVERPAVHLGDHHGLQGVLLALAALAISRRAAGPLPRAYVALLLAYGLVNAIQDFWLEQVVKRGWTGFEIPSVLTPKANWGWAVVVAIAAAGYAVLTRRPRPALR